MKVCCSGYFDPFHEGHHNLIKGTAKQGDIVWVIVNNDKQTKDKKGFVFIPAKKRAEMIRERRDVTEAWVSIDKDDSVCKTIRKLKPDVFCFGGDKKQGTTKEEEVCKELGIKMVWGVGGKKVNSSSQYYPQVKGIADIISYRLSTGKKILVAGNGGSASDSQHFVGELVGRYKKERKAYRAISLNTNTSVLTAIGNDYGFDKVFSRQVEALGDWRDILFLISTSGNSRNLVKAAKEGRARGLIVVGLLGNGGGRLKDLCHFKIIVKSTDTPTIQEEHIKIIHKLSELIEERLYEEATFH